MLFERIQLESEEKILRVVRKHWWIICTRVASALCIALLPLLLVVLIEVFLRVPELSTFIETYTSELLLLYTFWLLGCWMFIANAATDYYLDLWAITNRRIVAIEQTGFFKRRLSSFRLERLQDMNITVTGIIPTLLNFGTIEAQTAGGSNEEFTTAHMPDPRGLKALIIHAADVRQNETGRTVLRSEGL